jgi:hypothetical protein
MSLACTGLSEDLTCEELLAMLCSIQEVSREERHRFGVLIGKKTGQLLKQNKSSDLVRKELAEFVRNQIIKKSQLRQHRRK